MKHFPCTDDVKCTTQLRKHAEKTCMQQTTQLKACAGREHEESHWCDRSSSERAARSKRPSTTRLAEGTFASSHRDVLAAVQHKHGRSTRLTACLRRGVPADHEAQLNAAATAAESSTKLRRESQTTATNHANAQRERLVQSGEHGSHQPRESGSVMDDLRSQGGGGPLWTIAGNQEA